MIPSTSTIQKTSHSGASSPLRPAAPSSDRIFTRNSEKPATDSRPADADAAGRKLNYMQVRNGRFVPENTSAVANIPRIPAPAQPDSKELKMLRAKAGDLLGKMNRSASSHGGREVPFETHRFEKANVSLASDGAVTISKNGRPVVKMFRDAHDAGNIHVMMKGPDNRMHAGRDLPANYALEATRLINSAMFNARP